MVSEGPNEVSETSKSLGAPESLGRNLAKGEGPLWEALLPKAR